MKLSASVLAVQYLLSQETETFVEGIAVFGIAERGSITTTLVGFNGEIAQPRCFAFGVRDKSNA